MYYPRFWRRSSIGMVALISFLALIIACGSAAAPQPAPQESASVPQQQAQPTPTRFMSAQLIATATPIPSAPAVAPAASQGGGTAPTAAPLPTAAPPPAMQAEHGGFVTMMDYNAPTQKAIWEWAGSQLKNTSPVFNGLIEFNPETDDPLDIRGDLAERWEQPDATTYVFHLNRNARWHDGVPVTAADIVFSFDGMVCPTCNGLDELQGATRTVAIYTDNYYEEGNARAIDDYTVEVKTLFPAPAFLPTLALDVAKMLPRHTVIDERKPQTIKSPEDFNGSGPFLHTGYSKDVKNEYEANPDYWKEGYPRLDGMRHVIIIDSGSQIAAFQTGQTMMVNWIVHQIGVIDALKLSEELAGKVNFHWAGPILAHGVGFNTTKAPFDDVRVRQAINLALDRQEVVDVLSQGVHWVGAPVPPDSEFGRTKEELLQVPGYRYVDGAGNPILTGSITGREDLAKDPRDLEMARQLLTEAGHPEGFDVVLSARNAVGYPDEAAIVAEQLKRYLNINATIQTYESAAGYKAYDAGDFQFMVQGRSMALLDPDVIFAQWHESTMTRWGAGGAAGENFYHPGGFSNLYKQQSQELDLDKRKAIVRQMEDILVNEDSQYINLFWGARAFPVAVPIQNFHIHPSHYMGTKWEHIWCDPVDACN